MHGQPRSTFLASCLLKYLPPLSVPYSICRPRIFSCSCYHSANVNEQWIVWSSRVYLFECVPSCNQWWKPWHLQCGRGVSDHSAWIRRSRLWCARPEHCRRADHGAQTRAPARPQLASRLPAILCSPSALWCPANRWKCQRRVSNKVLAVVKTEKVKPTFPMKLGKSTRA